MLIRDLLRDSLLRLGKLSRKHQFLFACCCCERLLPNYRDFAEDEGWEEPAFLEDILSTLWERVVKGSLSSEEAQAIRDKIMLLPLAEDTCHTWFFLGMAQQATTAVCQCTVVGSIGSEEALRHVAVLAVEATREWLAIVTTYNTSPDEDVDIDLARRWGLRPPIGASTVALQKEKDKEFLHSSIFQGELDKQRFDVEVLEMHPEVTAELIGLLRHSSSQQGVQVRRRGLRVVTPQTNKPSCTELGTDGQT